MLNVFSFTGLSNESWFIMKNVATELCIILIGYFTLVPAIQVIEKCNKPDLSTERKHRHASSLSHHQKSTAAIMCSPPYPCPWFGFICFFRSSVCLLSWAWCPISSCRCSFSPQYCLQTFEEWRYELCPSEFVTVILFNTKLY